MMVSRMINNLNKVLKSKKAFGLLALFVGYLLIVDVNLQQRARLLRDHQDLFRDLITIDNGGGTCDIGDPHADGNPTPANAVKTLLVSYPGSGKRFTWTIIKALTNAEVADDWNFSEKLNEDAAPLTVKTSWPHREGVWRWNKMMDQVILLIRNPRQAIPSYHNMKFELDYATDWATTYANIPNLYTQRPAVSQWEAWRNERFNIEMDKWVELIDFWMSGGSTDGAVHSRCVNMEMDCHPKAVLDFDHFYQPNANSEFIKLNNVLEGSANVEVVSAQIRACVLDAIFDRTDLHEGGRPNKKLVPQYKFSLAQHDRMMNRLNILKKKYSSAPGNAEPTAADLVVILDRYMSDNVGERYLEAEIVLELAVENIFGDSNCSGLAPGVELKACAFMKGLGNHVVMTDDIWPDDFQYAKYLHERADLMRFYLSNFGTLWTDSSGWATASDHCTWFGVTCTENRVTSIIMPNNNITGDYPTDLDALTELETLDLSLNTLAGAPN